MAASDNTKLSKVLEQVDVEDATGNSADPENTRVNLIRLLLMYGANLSK